MRPARLRLRPTRAVSDIFISPLEDIYFVTELLGTDLHRLLTSRPLEVRLRSVDRLSHRAEAVHPVLPLPGELTRAALALLTLCRS